MIRKTIHKTSRAADLLSENPLTAIFTATENKMRNHLILSLALLCVMPGSAFAQQKLSLTAIKDSLQQTANPPLFVKEVLKKGFRLDTVIVTRTDHFNHLSDSLAYTGKIKKVYGPFTKGGKRFLIQILAKLPNTFYHVSQIFIDTSVFRKRIADSIGSVILTKLNHRTDNFVHLAQTYSMGGESRTGGDLGWVAKGALMPAIDKALAKKKKNEVFALWTKNGLHIIKLTDNPKQDDGFALMMLVFL